MAFTPGERVALESPPGPEPGSPRWIYGTVRAVTADGAVAVVALDAGAELRCPVHLLRGS